MGAQAVQSSKSTVYVFVHIRSDFCECPVGGLVCAQVAGRLAGDPIDLPRGYVGACDRWAGREPGVELALMGGMETFKKGEEGVTGMGESGRNGREWQVATTDGLVPSHTFITSIL